MDFPNFFLKLIGFKKRREEKMKSEHVFAFFISAYRTNISQRRPCRRRTWKTPWAFTTHWRPRPPTTRRSPTCSSWRQLIGGSCFFKPSRFHWLVCFGFLVCRAPFSEKAMAPHSSALAWKIPWMEEPGGLQSMGSLRVGHYWATSLSLFTFMHWRRKWQPTPVFLPGESQGWGSLVGCRLWGRTESNMTEAT